MEETCQHVPTLLSRHKNENNLPLDSGVLRYVCNFTATRTGAGDLLGVWKHHAHINLHPRSERKADGCSPINIPARDIVLQRELASSDHFLAFPELLEVQLE